MATPLKRSAADIATTAASSAKKPKVNASITSFFSAPAAKSANAEQTSPSSSAPNDASSEPVAAAAAAAPKFDKAKWLEKLTPDQKELLSLEIKTLDESWLAQLKEEVVSKEFLDLKRFLKKEKEAGTRIFPPLEDVYSWYVLSYIDIKTTFPATAC